MSLKSDSHFPTTRQGQRKCASEVLCVVDRGKPLTMLQSGVLTLLSPALNTQCKAILLEVMHLLQYVLYSLRGNEVLI